MRRAFAGRTQPPISSTKSMTGHSHGRNRAQEAIYCLLMLAGDFIAPSINIETLDPAVHPARSRQALSNRQAGFCDDEFFRLRRHQWQHGAFQASGLIGKDGLHPWFSI